MSTNHDDDTRPLPRGAVHGPAGDHPTTAIPRADAGRGDEATEVLSTADATGADGAIRPGPALPTDAPTARLRPEPATERITTASGASADTGTSTLPGTASSPPSSASSTIRTSAFPAGGPRAVTTAAPTQASATGGPAADDAVGVGTGGGRQESGGGGSPYAPSGSSGAPTGTPSDTPTSTGAGASWAVDQPPPVSTSLRVGTVVWGLVLAIIGAGVIAIAAGAQFDLELALIGLLALAGVALVVGSIVTSARRRR